MKKILFFLTLLTGSTFIFADQSFMIKEKYLQTYGCENNRSEHFCASLYNATSEIGVFNAVYEKQHNENKELNDRIVVLECCLCLRDTSICKNALSREQKESVNKCKNLSKITC